MGSTRAPVNSRTTGMLVLVLFWCRITQYLSGLKRGMALCAVFSETNLGGGDDVEDSWQMAQFCEAVSPSYARPGS